MPLHRRGVLMVETVVFWLSTAIFSVLLYLGVYLLVGFPFRVLHLLGAALTGNAVMYLCRSAGRVWRE